MYTPNHFKEEDLESMFRLMEQQPFATLITTPDSVPFVSHLPLMVERRGDKTVLIGHVAKANEQWQHFEQCNQTLVIFHGPSVYISPSLYQTPGVPTWNYVAVHAYGRPTLITDAARLHGIIEQLTSHHEQQRATPWQPDYPPRLLDVIVGFEMEIERIEGKYKLSQNRPEVDRRNIIQALSVAETDAARAVAALMQQRLDPA